MNTTRRKISSKISISRTSFLSVKFSTSSSTEQNFNHPLNLTTCIASLQSCAHLKNLKKGIEIHSYMFKSGLVDSPLSITSLINMYSKCNRVSHALLVFNNMSCEANVFTYNAMISGFLSNGFAAKGLDFYKDMREFGVLPDKFTFPCLIKCCCDLMEVLEVKKIHGLSFKLGLGFDVFIGSALVKTYLKFQLMEEAQKVFEELTVRDVVLWNAMINGYAQIGKLDEALGVFRRMSEEGVLISRFTVTGILSVFSMIGDFNNGRGVHGVVMKMGYDSGVAVMNALIDMYGKCKCIDDALEIFEMMQEKDLFSWNSIMAVHEQCGDHDGTLRLFDRMLRAGVQPDLVTVTTVLPACSHLAALMHGKEIHAFMIVNGLAKDGNCEDVTDVLMNNSLMDMYSKCGSMRDAHMVFNQMSKKDVASWNIMIMGYGMDGYVKEALDMFSQFCEAKLQPDEVTFVGVLSACSHSGFLRQGREFFEQMESKYGVFPTIEHYTCVIDMLGRAGKLKEAYELALTMPIEVNPVVWRTLLSACRLHANTDLAEIAAQRVFELEPGHCGSYVLMSNVYVAAGRYEEVLDVRHMMRKQNVKKTPGCSWIELKNGVHTFITGDQSHPEVKSIYAGLQSLTARLYENGYVPNI
ncbi:pentatricopeptide repeat-containing protein At3g14730 [Mangifera indica]|uniref:pentatricopeptide repeat-containing protein At3g14730 n=1 Tax=Mangifera indica TaxID=29780 RepID=UPI001CFB8420|nr:pentatricopeptide repeat-containing protein At3g14730 [Mangifera indica]XP_044496194.1 pentatricopeptide repeat-containing protein At3g14730 [Mangifera indica]